MPDFDHGRAAAAVRELRIALGEAPDWEGLRETPAQVARAYADLTQGLRQVPEDVLTTTFDLGHNEMVLIRSRGADGVPRADPQSASAPVLSPDVRRQGPGPPSVRSIA